MKRTFRITRHKPDVGRDVDDEIAFHLEMHTQELIASGTDPDEAERRARAAFGDLAQIEASCRRESTLVSWRRGAFEAAASIAADVRLGLRQIARRPGLSLIVLATWALVLGANTAIFSLVHGILLRPLPFPEPDRLATVVRGAADDAGSELSSSLADYLDLRDGADAFESVALHNQVSRGLGPPGHVQNVFSSNVTTSFFDVLGVHPIRGRTFREADGEPGAPGTVVISHDLWREQFGAANDVVGRELVLDNEPHAVIGVLPEGFLLGDWEARLWLPLTIPPDTAREALRRISGFELVARLTPGASLVAAQGQVALLDAAALETASAETRRLWRERGYRSEVRGLHDEQVRRVRPSLLLLFGGVLFVLVLGCVNIATLLLVRNTTRLRELATRLALGAGRRRVTRQLVTESVVLAVLGGALGLALGAWSLGLLEAFEAYEIPLVDTVALDGWAAFFVLSLTTLVGVAAGLIPALSVSSDDLQHVLRSGSMPGAAGRRLEWLRGSLVAAQVAVAFVLLVGAGLMLTSLARLQNVDPGFDTDSVLLGATVVPWDRYPTTPVRNQAIHDMIEGLLGIAGVEDAAVASQLPLSGVANQAMSTAERAGGPEASSGPAATASPFVSIVSPSYFSTLRIPLRSGRTFTEDDRATGDPVAVIDERLAHRFWPNGEPLGKVLRIDEGERRYTVVGVVGSIVQNDLTSPETHGAVYVPYRDTGLTFQRIALRTSVEPRSVATAARERLVSMNPDARFFWVQTMEEAADERLIFHRLPFYLMAGFALVALLLSSLGAYGVLAHSVAARTREFGLRKALGGTAWDLTRLTLRRGLSLVGAGLVLGTLGALGLTHFLSSWLYEVHPNDPLIFAGVAGLLALVGVFACLVPARRATRIDPVPALKAD